MTYIKGLRAVLNSIGATQSDQYAWVARVDNSYVFTAEIDHQDKERNRYGHKDGIFRKDVPPFSAALGDSPLTIKHGEELFNAVKDAHQNKLKCRLMLLKGTKNGTSAGGVRGAVDADWWSVTSLSGDTASGFQFVLERVP